LSQLRLLWGTTRWSALLGFLLGGGLSAREILGRKWVLEFQAGAPSSAREKFMAITQSAWIEGFGFAAIGFVFALLALGLARMQRDRSGSRFALNFACLAGGFFLWIRFARLGEEALPFLLPHELVLLNVVAILGGGLVCAIAAWLIRRLANRWIPDRWNGLLDKLRRRRGVPTSVQYTSIGLLMLAFATTVGDFSLSPLSGNIVYPELRARGEPGGPNVVFVTIDTLRADHLGCYGYDRNTSPFIDRLAEQGTLFKDASAPAAWTKPSTGTLLTGLYPSRHGALYHGSKLQIPQGEQTLAEGFQERGYVTAGFVSNPNIKQVFDFDRGFDLFFDSPVKDTVTLAGIRGTLFGQVLMRLLRHQFNWKYENDVRAMNSRVIPWLEKNAHQKFFLYVHYIDPHIPYSPPARYRDEFARDHGLIAFNERKESVGIDRYDAEIRYVDEGLGEFVDAIKRIGIWENTLFLITSDHGEEFFEHGVLGHGYSLYQGVIHVPLIFRGPGVPAGVVVESPVQNVDLAATLLDLADPEGLLEFGDGRSFAQAFTDSQWSTPSNYFLENEFGKDGTHQRAFVLNGVRAGPWKLVLTEENAFFPPSNPRFGREALYNLATDPAEAHNRILDEDQHVLVKELLGRLRRHAEFLTEAGFRDIEPAALSPDIQASLNALGY
jgi:arylsulfatase